MAESSKRYLLKLAYDGTNYFGWQIQTNHISVQQTINAAIGKILNDEVNAIGCGRTDTGVHASLYFAHFNTIKDLPDAFVYKLNCVLPNDIYIMEVFDFGDKVHARYDATERTYEYHLHFHKDPFLRHFSYYYPYYQLDFDKMQEIARWIPTYKDFKPLCRYSEKYPNTLCSVIHAEWTIVNKQQLKFTIKANRYLRSMVRRVVGASIMAGRGKLAIGDFRDVMDQIGEFKQKLSTPPQGLFLTDIKYPFFENFEPDERLENRKGSQ